LACCGETQVDNKAQSWVTMIQVFEYYSNHHMKKAFESVFGCVTCLPGCFTMYRIFTDDMTPLVTSDSILLNYGRNDIESLHEKNLFHLGEDRMLTTLLLKNFPGMRLSFVPEALCWTIVPHTFSILLSQRRRWINSTFHNMWELLKVETMCGICCVSMKMVVICDMIATMVLPASLIYAGYFVYLAVTDSQNIDSIVVILYGLMIGVLMLTFVIRARWDFLWWFAMFAVLGVPVFYFLLPLYSFWHMDDFSWGETRQVNTTNINDGEAKDSGGEEPVPDKSRPSITMPPMSDSDSSSSGEDDVALPVSTPPESEPNFPPVRTRLGSF
jgi:chitin synthase